MATDGRFGFKLENDGFWNNAGVSRSRFREVAKRAGNGKRKAVS
jgi:hypothetical protein